MRPRKTFVMWKHCFARVHCRLVEYVVKRCNFMSAGTGPASLDAPVSKNSVAKSPCYKESPWRNGQDGQASPLYWFLPW